MVFNGVTPEQAWRDTYFTDAELADPAVSGDAADPEGDGVSNLLEYLFGRDPWHADSAPAVTASASPSGANHGLLVSYTHNRNATDVTVTYETSSDLRVWTTASPQIMSDIVTTSETEQITLLFPSNVSPYFVRIRPAGAP